ncbi:ParB/RepB/Spo0J family partition protein [Actinomadura kijaniata]|uniref:ParB/RepB/Spo0J family partition protein n=1 Tax=Actinomadura kijaniata TaxID=46161 RepID=UPI0008377F1A|nr:ParB/RepB/Spo0J family partition protein [Actinomadura kijaniata]
MSAPVTADTEPQTAPTDPAQENGRTEFVPQAQPMMPLDRIKPDPLNPRRTEEELDLNPQFLDSLRPGVNQPVRLRIDPDEPGMFFLVAGHRRVAGARKVGLTEVPYSLKTDSSQGAALVEMYTENSPALRKNFDPLQEVLVLGQAHQAGVTKKQLSADTGLKPAEVRQAVKAGQMAPSRMQELRDSGYDWDLIELEVLAGFDEDDTAAVEALYRAKAFGQSLEHVASQIRAQRQEQAEHERLVAELTRQGVTITEEVPAGGLRLSELTPGDGQAEELTVEQHASCPGHGVYFWYSPTEPTAYCADPQQYGHGYQNPATGERMRLRAELIAAGYTFADQVPAGSYALDLLEHDGKPLDAAEHAQCPGARVHIPSFQRDGLEAVHLCQHPQTHGHTIRPGKTLHATHGATETNEIPRELVVRGNREWLAATEVRRKFLQMLARRRTSGQEVGAFVSRYLLVMPTPVRECLGTRATELLFQQFAGKSFEDAAKEAATASAGRRQVLLMAEILAAMEYEVAGPNDRRFTWRTDGKSNPHCRRPVAGAYLKELVAFGYQPSPIEKAVINGVPYTGADPDQAEVNGDNHGDSDGDSDGNEVGAGAGDETAPKDPAAAATTSESADEGTTDIAQSTGQDTGQGEAEQPVATAA